jgi:diguanylate cyclase (GGDEF)-like protein
MLDLDHFKAFNDSNGHAGGDELLVTVADAWRARLREGDVLARLGGEEFAVLLVGCELGAAVGVVESLRAQVPFGQSCSAGLAQWDRFETPEELLAAADAALYSAKAAGRDRTHLRRSTGDFVAARDPGRTGAASLPVLG